MFKINCHLDENYCFKPKVKQEAAWISTVLNSVSGGGSLSFILEIGAVWRKDNPSMVLQNFLTALN